MATAAITASPPVVVPMMATVEKPLHEVIEDQLVEPPPMSAFSTLIASRLSYHLTFFVREHSLGTVVTELLFILDAERNLRRRPDVAFVSAERWPLDRELPASGDWEVVPTLAVEVISPNDLFESMVLKVGEYFEYGAREVWLVVPEARQVYVYRSPTDVRIVAESEQLDGGALLSGFQLPLAPLFARVPGATARSDSSSHTER